MCRIDDDWDTLVSTTDTEALASSELICHDCGRVIREGELYTLYGMVPSDLPMTFAFQYDQQHRWVDTAKPFIRILDDDAVEAIEALGFEVDEVETEVQPELVEQCEQCYAANAWLVKVCHQYTVMVTREDLHEHSLDYSDGALGPAFASLDEWCQNGWRSNGTLVSRAVVQETTAQAIAHANAAGIVHD